MERGSEFVHILEKVSQKFITVLIILTVALACTNVKSAAITAAWLPYYDYYSEHSTDRQCWQHVW